MLLVVRESDKIILNRWDAWQSNCMELADEFIEENGLEFVRSEITFMGDMVYWVR